MIAALQAAIPKASPAAFAPQTAQTGTIEAKNHPSTTAAFAAPKAANRPSLAEFRAAHGTK